MGGGLAREGGESGDISIDRKSLFAGKLAPTGCYGVFEACIRPLTQMEHQPTTRHSRNRFTINYQKTILRLSSRMESLAVPNLPCRDTSQRLCRHFWQRGRQ